MRQCHLKMLLAPAQGAEVRHLPTQFGPFQQTSDHAGGLTKREPVQILDHQTELDGRIRE